MSRLTTTAASWRPFPFKRHRHPHVTFSASVVLSGHREAKKEEEYSKLPRSLPLLLRSTCSHHHRLESAALPSSKQPQRATVELPPSPNLPSSRSHATGHRRLHHPTPEIPPPTRRSRQLPLTDVIAACMSKKQHHHQLRWGPRSVQALKGERGEEQYLNGSGRNWVWNLKRGSGSGSGLG